MAEDIKAAFAGDVNAAFVDPLVDVDGQPPVMVMTWNCLPIHPKLGCFFMSPMSMRATFDMVDCIAAIIPAALQDEITPLRDFAHAAAT